MAIANINTNEVYNELNSIDQYISELSQLCDNVNPDISGGWDSEISRKLISPKIQKIKDDIANMRESIERVRGAVGSYTTGMEKADEAGAPTN